MTLEELIDLRTKPDPYSGGTIEQMGHQVEGHDILLRALVSLLTDQQKGQLFDILYQS